MRIRLRIRLRENAKKQHVSPVLTGGLTASLRRNYPEQVQRVYLSREIRSTPSGNINFTVKLTEINLFVNRAFNRLKTLFAYDMFDSARVIDGGFFVNAQRNQPV